MKGRIDIKINRKLGKQADLADFTANIGVQKWNADQLLKWGRGREWRALWCYIRPGPPVTHAKQGKVGDWFVT